jgi:hypothetical protein
MAKPAAGTPTGLKAPRQSSAPSQKIRKINKLPENAAAWQFCHSPCPNGISIGLRIFAKVKISTKYPAQVHAISQHA